MEQGVSISNPQFVLKESLTLIAGVGYKTELRAILVLLEDPRLVSALFYFCACTSSALGAELWQASASSTFLSEPSCVSPVLQDFVNFRDIVSLSQKYLS